MSSWWFALAWIMVGPLGLAHVLGLWLGWWGAMGPLFWVVLLLFMVMQWGAVRD